MKLFGLLMAMCVFVSPVFGQRQPQNAHSMLYFPQLADGGNQSERWQTTFIFVNVGLNPAVARLYITNNSGAPLNLDFGSGANSEHTIVVPSNGSRILRSRMASSATVTGWATAFSTTPLQATVLYRQFVNGVAKQEIAAQATLPTIKYTSPANRYLGVALANVYNYSINVDLRFYDSEGRLTAGPTRVTVPGLGHTAFMLSEKFTGLGEASGTLIISAAAVEHENDFVAWTLGSDSTGIWSSLPPGATAWPISHWDRINLVFNDIMNVVLKRQMLSTVPRLEIDYSKTLNAWAGNGTVGVTVGLSELISDSASELAFAVAHEIATSTSSKQVSSTSIQTKNWMLMFGERCYRCWPDTIRMPPPAHLPS